MLFYNAIKARFPEIQIISNARRGGNDQLPMDFVDEHIYTRPMAATEDLSFALPSRTPAGRTWPGLSA